MKLILFLFIFKIACLIFFYNIGCDYESFGREGGTPYFQRALTVVNNVPANEKAKYKGWNPFDGGISFTTGTINRFVFVDSWLNPRYKDFRSAFFSYHLNGLDRMYEDASQGRTMITSTLTMMQNVNVDNPNLLPMRIFFNAKSAELINIYSKSDMGERAIAVQLLSALDPTNADKYKQIGKK